MAEEDEDDVEEEEGDDDNYDDPIQNSEGEENKEERCSFQTIHIEMIAYCKGNSKLLSIDYHHDDDKEVEEDHGVSSSKLLLLLLYKP